MRLQTYERRTPLPVPTEEAFAWHARGGALGRLIPPWREVRLIAGGQGIEDGSRVELQFRVGPMPVRWIAEHRGCRPPREFRDVQIRGPMAHWEHIHRFDSIGPASCYLDDRVEYALPSGRLGRMIDAVWVHGQLDRMFAYRHATTVADLADHAQFADRLRLRVAVSGSSGLIGSTLVSFLTAGGHRVDRLARGRARIEAGELPLPTGSHEIDPAPFEGLDAVVHLAGENVAAGRWTPERKSRILDSRLEPTRRLCELLAQLNRPPRVLVCASAVGFYGRRADEPVSEDNSAGEGFLADVCRQWEAATSPASERGIRVVSARFGMVLSPRGGALAPMLRPFRLGLGGPMGDGRQYWSWISIDDAVGALHHALMVDELRGPMNVVSPGSVTNREFARTLARVLRRPAFCRMPAGVLRRLLGQMADEMILAGVRAVPDRLETAGYRFRHATLDEAFRHLLGGVTA
ncbi:MAG: TIGR01777 family oxidoreductase [Pirellulales bacterium]|nr:TIGR01777 family oxidoreductase [Pirellulales bacterium]